MTDWLITTTIKLRLEGGGVGGKINQEIMNTLELLDKIPQMACLNLDLVQKWSLELMDGTIIEVERMAE